MIFNFKKKDVLFEKLSINEKIIPSNRLNNISMIFRSKLYLALVSQSYALRLLDNNNLAKVKRTRERIVDLWKSLLSSLVIRTTSRPVIDLDVEACALFLFLFHHLDVDGRKSILLDLAKQITTLNVTTTSKNNFPSIIYARLLLFFEYLLRHFDEPSQILLDIVDKSLSTPVPLECKSENWCQKLYENLLSSDLRKPSNLFYNLCDDSSNNNKKKPNQLALSTLTSDDDFNYNEFYSCLIQLGELCVDFNSGRGDNMVMVDDELGLDELVSVSYTFDFVWSLTDPEVLKVSEKFIGTMETDRKRPTFRFVQFLRVINSRAINDEILKTVTSARLTSSDTQFFLQSWSCEQPQALSLSDLITLNFQIAQFSAQLELSLKK